MTALTEREDVVVVASGSRAEAFTTAAEALAAL
jgi:hypothetical protein